MLLLTSIWATAGAKMELRSDFLINEATYEWTRRIIGTLKKILGVNLELHQNQDQVHAGDIFLFNHFTRFETFIPQYLIFQETGAYCRTVAASELFVEGSQFSNYLLDIGGVPNNHPRLLPFLAEEILRGRRVIIFPEGGMLKDRRVVNSNGDYHIFSPMAQKIRKHHSGAAVLALALDAFKMTLLRALDAGNMENLQGWAKRLGINDVQELIAAARRPTMIVPTNITFYPIRVSDNILHKVAELLTRGLSRKLSEEFLIEGNILLKNTDMDIRLGDPVQVTDLWSWWERHLVAHLAGSTDSLDGLFRRTPDQEPWKARLGRLVLQRKVHHVRDECMRRMYAGVTVNLSHLASLIMLSYLNRGQTEIDRAVFHKTLYLAVKKVQKDPSIFLHRSLNNPEAYSGLIYGQCHGLEQFLKTIASMELVESDNGRYRFLPKLCREYKLDEVRLENLVAVYANEVSPISGVNRAVKQAIEDASAPDGPKLARLCFDDELLAYSWDKQSYSKPRYKKINDQEAATESGAPFLFLPKKRKDLGVVLVHGFLASPAEVRPFGEKLKTLGYPVIGVRLKGHGNSPWDLRERNWEEWLESVRRAYEIMSMLASRVSLVGFSTGGALSLRLASDRPDQLVGVAAVSVPIRFRDRNMIFVPLVHGANQLVRKVSSFEGIMAFRLREPEHPHINYRNVPIRALYELGRMVDDLEDCLADVQCPVTLIQGTDDPIVDPISAEIIYKKLDTNKTRLVKVAAERHGILYDDIGSTQEKIVSFLADLCSSNWPEYNTTSENLSGMGSSTEKSASP